ncbi:transmembrane receptor [Apiospora arundinis]
MSTTNTYFFSPRRSRTQRALRIGLSLLFSISSFPGVVVWAAEIEDNSLDQVPTSLLPPPGVSTSEILEVGPPPTKHSSNVPTRTVTITIAYKPTLALGDPTYSLLGCYGHTGFEGVHPFGKEKDYATPPSLDAKNMAVDSCLKGCASLPLPNKTAGQFMYVGLKNGSECFCAVELSPEADKLSGDNCTAACPGDPRLSCGGKDALAIYSLISTTQKEKDKLSSSSSTSSPTSSPSANTRLTSTSESPLTNAPAKAPGIGMGALTPSTAPTSSHPPAFEGKMNSGGDGPPAPASTATVAAISGSMSGAILIGALLFFCFRAYKKRRIEQDARVAAMVLARNKKGGEQLDGGHDNDDNNRGHSYERSPSRGRRRTRDYHHRPPSIIVAGDAFREDKDVRLTTDGVLVPTTPALESGGKDPASYYHNQQHQYPYNHTVNNQTNALGSGDQQAPRDSLFSALLGQVAVPVGPRTPPAMGASSAVQWRRTADMAAAQSVPVSPMTKAPDHVAMPPGGLGERAWHRRRISTPYAPPPTTPLPPTPPNKKKRIVAAAASLVGGGRGRGRGGEAEGSDRHHPLEPPQRPPRRESAATFEAAPPLPHSPGAATMSSIPDSYLEKTLEYDGDDEEGGSGSGVKPVPPLKTRTSQQPPPRGASSSNNNNGMGGMAYIDRHHKGVRPTIPSLPPITPGELSEFDSRYWKSLVGGGSGAGMKRHDSGGSDDLSPDSATTVGTSILMESPTLPWDSDPTQRTAEHEKRN